MNMNDLFEDIHSDLKIQNFVDRFLRSFWSYCFKSIFWFLGGTGCSSLDSLQGEGTSNFYEYR